MNIKFDAIIIGSGQAGTPLAFKMAAKGKKVAFIEKEHLEAILDWNLDKCSGVLAAK